MYSMNIYVPCTMVELIRSAKCLTAPGVPSRTVALMMYRSRVTVTVYY